MKKVFIILLLTAFLTVGCQNKKDEVLTLKVATLNIDIKAADDFKLEREFIASEGVEICGIQEIDQSSQRYEETRNVDPVKEFAKSPYKDAYFGKAVEFGTGSYGTLVVSMYAFQEKSTVALFSSEYTPELGAQLKQIYKNYDSRKPDTVSAFMAIWGEGGIMQQGALEPRAYTRVVIEKDGKKVAFYNTHLSYEVPDVRKNQLNTLKNALDSDPVKYKILVGDLNTDLSTDEYDLFLDKYNIANGKDGVWLDTFTGEDPSMHVKSVDNIITSKNIEIVNVYTVKNDFSDHLMLVAEIQLD